MSAVGFEPTRSKTLRPERNPLDHSGKLTRTTYKTKLHTNKHLNTTHTKHHNKHTHTYTHTTHRAHTHAKTHTTHIRNAHTRHPTRGRFASSRKSATTHSTQHTAHNTLQPKCCNAAPSEHR